MSVVLAAIVSACVGDGPSDGTADLPSSPRATAASSPATGLPPSLKDADAVEIEVGLDPGYATVGAGSVWVGNHRGGSISRIDPSTNKVTATIAIEGEPTGMLVAAGGVWTSGKLTGLVHEVDPATDEVVARVRLTGTGGESTVSPPTRRTSGSRRTAVWCTASTRRATRSRAGSRSSREVADRAGPHVRRRRDLVRVR